jgi:L-arabinonolactonase
MLEIRCVTDVQNDLGEGPWWDAATGSLWWVDAWRSRLWRHRPHDESVESHALPAPIASEPLGSMVLDAQGRVVCATRSDFWRVDLMHGKANHIAAAEHDRPPSNRLNDGKCDRLGRYWCGSLNTDWTKTTGALYRLDANAGCTRVIDQHGLSNGIAFSPDDRHFYFADTAAGVVWRFDFDLASGSLSNRRVFINMSHIAGMVDGATVDADGHYWCALFGAGAVARFDPAGRLVSRIELPTRDPTMCSFGGANFDTLFVTTARRFLDQAQREAQPWAGALLAIHGHGARGLPEPCFAG